MQKYVRGVRKENGGQKISLYSISWWTVKFVQWVGLLKEVTRIAVLNVNWVVMEMVVWKLPSALRARPGNILQMKMSCGL